ncbi:hypothetical protein BURKHO8Y_140329 [Burkholderia sp. 8Y]|nr:hypothetical protein BURKHO8Y_140329 [Burkholderia sp. 8Y]
MAAKTSNGEWKLRGAGCSDCNDRFAFRSRQKALSAQANGIFDNEIEPVSIAQKRGEPTVVSQDEHPRDMNIESLSRLKGVKPQGTVTAGNASGVNGGAAALLLASAEAAFRCGLKPKARILGMATAGVAPRIMGIGPAPAVVALRHHRAQRSCVPANCDVAPARP